MNEINKKNEKKDLTTSNKHFENLLKICLIIGIVIVSGFIIYYILTPEPGYATLGILNEEQKAENYPTEAMVNETISFYVTVENKMEREFSFRIEILKGDNETIVNSSGSINALSYFNTTKTTLCYNQFWMSDMLNISFSQPGAKQRVIVELWEIKGEIEVFYNNVYLWLNITN
ncbi:MAG: DUF1616 domain-containing protein [Candidatus Lokiarchaeota archaeon]|nr:DUF1616 domain-containing protein [Candidatus Lokiarchaeota archaeon]